MDKVIAVMAAVGGALTARALAAVSGSEGVEDLWFGGALCGFALAFLVMSVAGARTETDELRFRTRGEQMQAIWALVQQQGGRARINPGDLRRACSKANTLRSWHDHHGAMWIAAEDGGD